MTIWNTLGQNATAVFCALANLFVVYGIHAHTWRSRVPLPRDTQPSGDALERQQTFLTLLSRLIK